MALSIRDPHIKSHLGRRIIIRGQAVKQVDQINGVFEAGQGVGNHSSVLAGSDKRAAHFYDLRRAQGHHADLLTCGLSQKPVADLPRHE